MLLLLMAPLLLGSGGAPSNIAIEVVSDSLTPSGSRTVGQTTYETVSGLDNLLHDVTLTNAKTGDPITTGTVTVSFCESNTTTALGAGSTATLTHDTDGRWTGVTYASDLGPDLPALRRLFDRVLTYNGVTTRRLARCQRVDIVDVGDAADR